MLGGKKVGEKADSPFLQIPGRGSGPKSGEFVAAKTRLHADASIVLGDGVATEESEELRSDFSSEAAPRFGDGEKGGAGG